MPAAVLVMSACFFEKCMCGIWTCGTCGTCGICGMCGMCTCGLLRKDETEEEVEEMVDASEWTFFFLGRGTWYGEPDSQQSLQGHMGARSICQPPGSWLGLGLEKTSSRGQNGRAGEAAGLLAGTAWASCKKVGMVVCEVDEN